MTGFDATVVVAGQAEGPVVALDEPLSLWGGLDPGTGRIIDHYHPQLGADLSGAIVVMVTARGSSSAASVLAEAARAGTAPAGFVVRERDEILSIGAIVATEMYDVSIPVIEVRQHDYDRLAQASTAAISPTGRIELQP